MDTDLIPRFPRYEFAEQAEHATSEPQSPDLGNGGGNTGVPRSLLALSDIRANLAHDRAQQWEVLFLFTCQILRYVFK